MMGKKIGGFLWGKNNLENGDSFFEKKRRRRKGVRNNLGESIKKKGRISGNIPKKISAVIH